MTPYFYIVNKWGMKHNFGPQFGINKVWCHIVAHHKRNAYTKILCSKSSLFCETHTHGSLHQIFILFGFCWAWKVIYHVFVNVNIVMFCNFCQFCSIFYHFMLIATFFWELSIIFQWTFYTFFLSFIICECNQMKVYNIQNGGTTCIAIVVSQFCV